MKVRILFIDTGIPFCKYEKYLNLISEERIRKIARFRFDKDKTVSLFTELLIRHEVSEQLKIPYHMINFSYGEFGKLGISGRDDYHFSVSHSGNCIVFADCNEPIGIDIEKVSKANMSISRNFFTGNEHNLILNSVTPNNIFYKIWTSKEAYLKMLGVGLSKPLKSFDTSDGSLSCSFVTKNIDDFIITICRETFFEEYTFLSVKPNRLLNFIR